MTPQEIMKLRNEAGQLKTQWCLRYQKSPIGQSDRLRDEAGNPLCSTKGCLIIHGDIPENDPDYPVALQLSTYNQEAKKHRDTEWARLVKEAEENVRDQAWAYYDPWKGSGK